MRARPLGVALPLRTELVERGLELRLALSAELPERRDGKRVECPAVRGFGVVRSRERRDAYAASAV